MIQITELAVKQITETAKANNLPDGISLRPFIAGYGCHGPAYQLKFEDDVKDTDSKFEISGVKIVIEAGKEELFSSVTIDYDEERMGFVFKNPLAQAGGGCGSCSSGGCSS
jgi:iron-sulfur cluster assembly protein